MCRSQRELSNEYLLAKIGVDTAENEPCKVCPLSVYRSPRYRNCYAALIGFKDELCSLWYYMQLQVIRSPPLKLLLDAHMVWYNMGLLQYLYEKTDEPEVEGVEVIRRDFIPRDLKRCALFADYGQGYTLCWL